MIKKTVANQLAKIPLVNQYYAGTATIFMLHRVADIDSKKLLANENMKVSPSFLTHFIETLLKHDYEIISLDRLHEILIAQEDTKKKVVFTLDDGYVDNLTNALPVFEEFNASFTVYVSTSFPDQTGILWWYALEDLILNNHKIKLADGSKYACSNSTEKQRTFLAIRQKILKLNQESLYTELRGLFSAYKISWQSYVKELSLSWKQIATMAKHPLVTIGGHTVNHYTLNQLPSNMVIDEITLGNQKLQQVTHKKIEHFAYPFGSRYEIGKREIDLVASMGLKTATTTRVGNIYLAHKNSLSCLPRIMLTESFELSTIGKPRRTRFVTL